MNRISEYRFVEENIASNEGIHLIRIQDRKIFWVAESHEYPECGEENPEGIRICAVYNSPIRLDISMLMETGVIEETEADDYENTSLVFYYETEEEYEEFFNVSECFLSLAQAKEGHNEVDIFMVTREELSDVIDILTDGDYIIVPEEVLS